MVTPRSEMALRSLRLGRPLMSQQSLSQSAAGAINQAYAPMGPLHVRESKSPSYRGPGMMHMRDMREQHREQNGRDDREERDREQPGSGYGGMVRERERDQRDPRDPRELMRQELMRRAGMDEMAAREGLGRGYMDVNGARAGGTYPSCLVTKTKTWAKLAQS